MYRKAALFKQSVEGAKAYCNLLTLRETAKLNGIKDVAGWHRAVHRAFYEYVERTVWTARCERLRSGEPLRLRLQGIPAEVIESFDWKPWLPWNYAKTLAADERCTPVRPEDEHLHTCIATPHGSPAGRGAAACARLNLQFF